jgi:NAD(P)-dependent dehydrogenase (short-subunit alcohol dehydrogenase family)
VSLILSPHIWRFKANESSLNSFKCLRSQLKAMKNGGAIVNMTSVAGLDGAAGCGAYSPSKHAVSQSLVLRSKF